MAYKTKSQITWLRAEDTKSPVKGMTDAEIAGTGGDANLPITTNSPPMKVAEELYDNVDNVKTTVDDHIANHPVSSSGDDHLLGPPNLSSDIDTTGIGISVSGGTNHGYVFDGNSGTQWVSQSHGYNTSGSKDRWIRFFMNTQTTPVAGIRANIVYSESNPEPNNEAMFVEGSDDDLTWTLLVLDSTQNQNKEISLEGKKSYKYYRLSVDSQYGDTSFDISEVIFRSQRTDLPYITQPDGTIVVDPTTQAAQNTRLTTLETTTYDKTTLDNRFKSDPLVATVASGHNLDPYLADPVGFNGGDASTILAAIGPAMTLLFPPGNYLEGQLGLMVFSEQSQSIGATIYSTGGIAVIISGGVWALDKARQVGMWTW